MSKFVIISILLAFLYTGLNAQVLDPDYGVSVWKKENTKQASPAKLSFVREDDVMFSKRIWRTIDLRQKQNLPLYYPVADSVSLGRRSIIQVIYDEIVNAVENPGENALKMYHNYELREPIPNDQVMNKILKTDTLERIIDPVTCESETYAEVLDFFTKIKPEITKITLMEDWFFDKQRSVMDVRILALAIEVPIYTSTIDVDPICGITVFGGWNKVENASNQIWFFFPDLRDAFAKSEYFNEFNETVSLSYDDILLNRMFDSYVIKEANKYDRFINEYTSGIDALLEAERITEGIRNYEMNLWQY